MVKKICINDSVTFYVELGHTLTEWKNKYGKRSVNWDFPIEEFVDGTIEPNSDMIYWLIDNRIYETNM